VRFGTYNNASVMPGVARAPGGFGPAPWPYVEGLTIQEVLLRLFLIPQCAPVEAAKVLVIIQAPPIPVLYEG
jgi:hypothetical protein